MKRIILTFGILLGFANWSLAQVTAPITQTFSTGSTPTGWTTSATSGGPWLFTGSTNSVNCAAATDHTGNSGNYAWMDQSGTDAGVLLTMPDVNVGSLTTPFLEFYYWMCGIGYTPVNITYVETYNGTSWSVLDTINTATSGWKYFGYDLTGRTHGTNLVRVRFRAESGGSGSDFYGDNALDDVSIIEAPTCQVPLGLSAHNISATGATLNWNVVSNAVNGYEIIYGSAGFDPAIGGTSATSTTDSLVITGLTGSTTYEAYIIADCGTADGISDTSAPVSFTTNCVPITATYTTDFDTDTDGAVALCWNQYNSYSTSAYARVENQGTPRSGTQQLALYSYFQYAAGDTLVSISPEFSDLTAGDKQINFWTKTTSTTNQLIVGTLSSAMPGATFTPMDTITFGNSNIYQEIIVPFTTANGYNGTDQYIGLAHSLGATFSYIYIDDFTYEVIPPCPTLTGINITNIGITTAEIQFNGTADSVDYEYGPVGFTQGTGTINTLANGPYTITGLASTSCYDVYVRNNCTAGGNGTSSWDGPFTFCTLCTTVSLPYSEDFDNNLGCFSAVDGGTSADTWEQVPAGGNGNYFGDIDGTGHASADSDGAGSGPTLFEELVSPYIDASNIQGTLYLEFDQFYDHLGSSSEVEVWDGTAWVNILTQNTADVGSFQAPNSQKIDITAYANDSLQVKFIYDDQGAWAWWWLIDNVLVHDVTCPNPTALNAINQGMSQVDLTWTTGGASNWIVEYGLPGFTLGTGTVINATNDTITVTGLTSATAYEFYVRDSCSTGALSNWAGPFQFSTSLCAASQRCDYIFDLYDTFGDGWNGAEITIRQNGIAVAQLGSNFTTGSSLTGLVVSLCDNLPTEVVLTTAGSWPGEIEFDVFNSGALVAQHTAAPVSQGDTLANFTSNCPTCPSPTGRMVSSIADTGATISWTNFSGSNQTEIWFGPQGFYQGSQSVGGTKIFSTGSSVILDTLTSSKCYEVYLRSICAPGDSGAWVGPLNFCTPCNVISAPFVEDFENHTLGFFQGDDNCWTIQNTAVLSSNTNGYSWELRNAVQTTSGGTGADRDATLFPSTGGQFFNADVSYGTSGDSSMLISPIVDISGLTNPELEYNVHRYGNNMAEFYVDIYDGTQWVNGVHSYTSLTGTQTSNGAAWTDTIISLSAYSGITNFQVRFRTVSNGCCAGDNGIDQVRISDPVTCPDPDNLNVTNLTSTSGDFTFSPGAGTVNSFEISFGPGIQNPAAGTIVTHTSSTYTLSNLLPSTQYCVFVRDICSAGDTSFWAGPYCFTTLCPPSFNAPYHTDFEGIVIGNQSTYDNCWTTVNAGTLRWESEDSEGFNENSLNTGPFYDATFPTTTKGVYMYLETSSTGTSAELISPAIDISVISAPELQYYYHMYGATINRLEIYAEDVNSGARTFVDSIMGQQQTAGSDSFRLRTVNLVGLTPGTYKFVFVGFRGSSFTGDIAIDEMAIINNACPGVANVGTANHGCDSIELNWNSATGGSIIEYGLAGFTPGTGTFTGIVTPPYSVTGLSAGNTYTFRIADTCGIDTSAYSSITDTTVSGPLPIAAFSIDSAFVNGEYVVYVNAVASQNADTYKWIYSNKTDFGIVDTNSFTTNGPETIMLVVSNGCGSDTATFTTYSNIGLENLNAPDNLRVYPNPTNDLLHISFLRSDSENVEISLMDAQGRVVLNITDKALTQSYENKLSLGKLATGVYMLEIRNGDKLSKQRIVLKH